VICIHSQSDMYVVPLPPHHCMISAMRREVRAHTRLVWFLSNLAGLTAILVEGAVDVDT